MIAGMLKIAQPGVVRSDLDADTAATLFIALFDGIAMHRAIANDAVDLEALAQPTGDLIERFVGVRATTRSRQSRRPAS
jgi:hypothetical protein